MRLYPRRPHNSSSYYRLWLLFLLFLSGCTSLVVKQFDTEYGVPSTQNRMVDISTSDGEFYFHQIKPILENRCVVCHGCYDAPCQLKLSSPEGIDRGLTSQKIYATRLSAMEPTRLFEDAQSTGEWRKKGFNSVLNERHQNQQVNLQLGLLYKVLDLKRNNPLVDTDVLADDYDFSINRIEICPTIETYDEFSVNHPDWGMPFGLPALTDSEFIKIEKWLANGALMASQPKLKPQIQKEIESWEIFLNQDSNKHRLMSRYIYEHLFLAHLYFDNEKQGDFFTLVRSKTPPGKDVERISTRLPYGDPGIERIYYRLIREKATILDKTHLPYLINKARMERWQELFIDVDYDVPVLPHYQMENGSNPFIIYQDIPVRTRYQFLLDDAQVFLMGFIKGPVCRGEIALDVIDDRFWVFFADPDAANGVLSDNFLAAESEYLRLPNKEKGGGSLLSWNKYAELQANYFQDRVIALENNNVSLDMKTVWNGDGNNPNSALTIFRHFDNATVVQGMVGEQPKTAWFIDYALFERIHYLLVAGFDPFGSVSHKLTTRLYMDFLRMEGELNFTEFLPPENRMDELYFWYRGAEDEIYDYLEKIHGYRKFPTNIQYVSNNYKSELFQKLQKHLSNSLSYKYSVQKQNPGISKAEQPIARLGNISGKPVSILPEVIVIRLIDLNAKEHFYTLIHNRGYANVTSLFNEDKNRLPDEDTLTLVPGFVGSYPNVFWDVDTRELDDLIRRVETLSSESDYHELLDFYGVRRTSEKFWDLSDRAHAVFKQTEPIESGLLDYNRLENR